MSIIPIRGGCTGSRRATPPVRRPRCSCSGYVIRGAGRSMRRPATCGSATSGARRSRSSTCSHPASSRARTATRWAAIIGGQVYHGSCFPDLDGWYVYGDEQIGAFARARLRADRTLEVVDLQGTFPLHPTSFHVDARGELYATDASGSVYRIEA